MDMLILLKLVEDGHILSEICKDNIKLEIIHQGLIRKGLVTTDNKLTLAAKNILKFLQEKAPKEKLTKNKPNPSEFDRWWKAFPGTDIFNHNGKAFKGTRTLKKDQENCRLKFNAILAEGEYTADELIKALEYDVLNKKENSVKTGENKLKYLQNALTYLNQRSYEPYVELVKEGIVIEEKSISKGVDI
jgi:hypothetical protein